jgi:hypothetical protein
MFDVVYIGGKTNTKDTVFNGFASVKMLRHNGIIIFDNYDQPIVKAGVDIISPEECGMISLYNGDIAVYTF